MNKQKAKQVKQQRRKARVRSKIFGIAEKPRLSVSRSLKYVYAQLIDDENRTTLAAIFQKKLNLSAKIGKTKAAFEVGKELARLAAEKKIKKCVFDRGRYKYHGRVKAVADGAREGGLIF